MIFKLVVFDNNKFIYLKDMNFLSGCNFKLKDDWNNKLIFFLWVELGLGIWWNE